MSHVPHLVSEIVARLGERILDEREIAAEVARAHDDHWLAPCAWVRVERTLLSLRARRIREHATRLDVTRVGPVFPRLRAVGIEVA